MLANHQLLTVAVTGLNAIDSPGPGVAVIRALREGFPDRVRIIGLSYETMEPGIYLHNIVDKTYTLSFSWYRSFAKTFGIYSGQGKPTIDYSQF